MTDPRFTFQGQYESETRRSYWVVYMDGKVVVGHYFDRSLAKGYCEYMNGRNDA